MILTCDRFNYIGFIIQEDENLNKYKISKIKAEIKNEEIPRNYHLIR